MEGDGVFGSWKNAVNVRRVCGKDKVDSWEHRGFAPRELVKLQKVSPVFPYVRTNVASRYPSNGNLKRGDWFWDSMRHNC